MTQVGLTFVIVMMVILIIIHLLEIFALVKLASLKGDFFCAFVVLVFFCT